MQGDLFGGATAAIVSLPLALAFGGESSQRRCTGNVHAAAVMALIGAWRYQEQRSVPQIHQQLQQRNICISERSVSNLLNRYDELLALKLGQCEALKARLTQQQRVILAIDGLQPDMGHEVLWVLSDRDLQLLSLLHLRSPSKGFNRFSARSQQERKIPRSLNYSLSKHLNYFTCG